jgi:hypothetical protein
MKTIKTHDGAKKEPILRIEAPYFCASRLILYPIKKATALQPGQSW